jgi:cathepsin A (carboxypeptidase C)
MIGLFTEMGPCWLDVDVDHASPNPWSWNNNASVLFIDQPAGSGLSHLMDGLPLPTSEYDTAPDFEKFLNIFFTDVFPEKWHLPIHIAAESYGGHYGPVYIQHILKSRRDNPDTAFWGKIKSLVLINAGVDFTGLYVGVWDTVCKNREQVGWFNASACDAVADHLSEQKRLGRICQASYDNEACRAAYDFGQKYMFAAMWDLVAAGKVYMGNLKKPCRPIRTYPFCVDPDIGNVTRFLNQDWAKLELHKEPSFLFRDVNLDMHLAFRQNGSWSLPATRQLGSILDASDDDMSDFRVLVLNGNLDFYSNTAGNMWVYERLEWSGQDEYREMEWRPLMEGLAATGSWKGTDDGRLVFISVDEAGHTVPSDVREGSYRIVQEWLNGGWRL